MYALGIAFLPVLLRYWPAELPFRKESAIIVASSHRATMEQPLKNELLQARRSFRSIASQLYHESM
jgi:hypothetical protein